ncbi:MAG: hypothetical protein J0H88_05215 [Sphingomonadales bacterium]|nr:hypothetical protein [Sphingomonadales bacterium]
MSQTLVSCPAADGADASPSAGLEIAYDLQIVPKASADRQVVLDGTGGFLVDRKTKITLAEDGTLKSFNGASEGQGGPFLASLIKVAATAYGLGAPALPGAARPDGMKDYTAPFKGDGKVRKIVAYRLTCKADVQKLVAKLAAVDADIADLETLIAQGLNSPSSDALLAQRKKEALALADQLTLPVELVLSPSTLNGAATNLVTKSDPTTFAEWFEVAPVEDRVSPLFPVPAKPSLEQAIASYLTAQNRTPFLVGQYGYQLQITPDARMQNWLGCGNAAGQTLCTAIDANADAIRSRDLYYRRPVPASVKLIALDQPCASAPCADPDDNWIEGKDVAASQSVKLPQLSRLYSLPTGGGGIFGSRAVSAEFGGFGEPLMLSYERGSISGDLAGVMNAGAEAATSIDEARLSATKSRIDRIKARRELEDLLDETP